MAQFAQGLGFYLSDTLAGDVELFADFFQRVVGVHLDTETHAQHFGFALRQAVEDVLGDIAQTVEHGRINRCQRVGIFDEVAQQYVDRT